MRKNHRALVAEHNQPKPLADYLIPLVGDRKEVTILDVGSGPFSVTGQTLEGVDVQLTRCDSQDFGPFWDEVKTQPLFPVEYQDMEHLTYPDNSFDIVVCLNALDHTKDAIAALLEMLRVSREWVYIDCALDQLTSQGKKHYWDAKEDGTFVNKTSEFNLKDFGFQLEYIDNQGERQYNHIIGAHRG